MINILNFIFQLLSNLIYFYTLLVVIYTLFTWVPALLNSKVGIFLGKIVEPYLGFFDRYIPAFAGISFSPVVAVFVLYLLNRYVLYAIFSLILRLFY